jgi:hypothetical protein
MGKEDFQKCVTALYEDIQGDNALMARLHSSGKDHYTRECTDHLETDDCDEGFSPYFVGLSDTVLAKNNKGYLASEYPEKYQSVQRNHLNHAEHHEMAKCGKVSPTTRALLNLSQNIGIDFRLPSMDDFKDMWVFKEEHSWIQNLTKLLNMAVIAVVIYMVANVLLQMMSRGEESK